MDTPDEVERAPAQFLAQVPFEQFGDLFEGQRRHVVGVDAGHLRTAAAESKLWGAAMRPQQQRVLLPQRPEEMRPACQDQPRLARFPVRLSRTGLRSLDIRRDQFEELAEELDGIFPADPVSNLVQAVEDDNASVGPDQFDNLLAGNLAARVAVQR